MSSQYFFNNIVMANTPAPYIGQYGPIKNPLFTNFFFLITSPVDSIIHPANEYIKNSNIKRGVRIYFHLFLLNITI